MNAKDLLAKLRELKPSVEAGYKTMEIGLFGSYIRGEQDINSDIDVLVEFKAEADLFDLMGLTLYLEETLQQKVDVVSKNALRKELRNSVLSEMVPV